MIVLCVFIYVHLVSFCDHYASLCGHLVLLYGCFVSFCSCLVSLCGRFASLWDVCFSFNTLRLFVVVLCLFVVVLLHFLFACISLWLLYFSVQSFYITVLVSCLSLGVLYCMFLTLDLFWYFSQLVCCFASNFVSLQQHLINFPTRNVSSHFIQRFWFRGPQYSVIYRWPLTPIGGSGVFSKIPGWGLWPPLCHIIQMIIMCIVGTHKLAHTDQIAGTSHLTTVYSAYYKCITILLMSALLYH